MSWEKEYDAKQALAQARQITKGIKYDDTHIEIITEIRALAEKHGIDEKELEYHINRVYEAKKELESAIYGLDEPFEDALRYASYDDDEEVNEVSDRFEKDFMDIFGDLKAREPRERPRERPQADRDRPKPSPDKDKSRKDTYESLSIRLAKSQSSHILEGIMSKTDRDSLKRVQDKFTDYFGADKKEEEVYVMYLDGKPSMKFKDKDGIREFLAKIMGPGGLDPKLRQSIEIKKEVRPINEDLDMFTEGKKDACYHKVKSRYKVWPSAYASGALVKCRKVGASNWGNKSKKK